MLLYIFFMSSIKTKPMRDNKIMVPCLIGAFAGIAGAEPLVELRSDFARDVLSGRASVFIIGDSTNSPRGAAISVPYYEAFLRRLPTDVPVCGFRISASPGQTAVNGYMSFVGGATSQMVDGWIKQGVPWSSVVPTSEYTPPGYRSYFQIVQDGSLPDGSRFAEPVVRNLSEICPAAVAQWSSGSVVMRTPVVVGPSDQKLLSSVAFQSLAQLSPGSSALTAGPVEGIDLSSDAWGLRPVDVRFESGMSVEDGRDFGIRIVGDLDDDDANESLATMTWCDQSLFSSVMADVDHGFVLDSVSIAGFSAFDHAFTLDDDSLSHYVKTMPRLPTWIVVWLGQNMSVDEWTGQLTPIYLQRIESIVDRAKLAIESAEPGRDARVAIVVPPQVSGDYPWSRFEAIKIEMESIAAQNDWAVIDLLGLVGNSLDLIVPTYTPDGFHPSLTGAEHVTDLFYDAAACWSSDTNGDGQINFFDLAEYISWFAAGDERADLDGSLAINFFDIATMLDRFSKDCSD